jgi:twinkle protein
MDVKGTGAITDMVDNVISVWRNKPKEEAIQKYSMGNKELPAELKDKPDCVLTVQKQRNFDWEGKIHLWLDRATHQYLEWGQTVAPMLEIEDESDGDRETMQDNRRTENEH